MEAKNKSKNSHWPLTLLGGVSSLFNLFIPIVMSRLLSPDQVGEFKLFFLYLAIVPALSLGVGFLNGAYLWGAEKASGDRKIFASLVLVLGFGTLATLVAFLFGKHFLATNLAVLTFALACIPTATGGLLDAKLVAAGSVKKAAFFSASFEFLRLAGILLMVFWTRDIQAVFWMHVFVVWLKFLVIAFVVAKNGREGYRQEISAVIRYAVPVSLAAIFDLLLLNADRYVLSGILPAAEFAIYTFGCLVLPPLLIFEQSINQVLIPKLAHAFAKNHSRLASKEVKIVIEELFLFMLPATVFLALFAEPLIRLLFTAKYLAGVPFLSWYALYYTILSIPQDIVARARANSTWILRTAIVFGIVATGTTVFGAWVAGAGGALKGFLLAQAARRVYAIWFMHKSEDWRLQDFLPLRSFFIFIVGALFASILGFGAAYFCHLPITKLLFGGGLFALAYFGFVLFFQPRLWRRTIRFLQRAQV